MHGFKTEIRPNNKQITMFEKHAGVARHAWNWALELCIKRLDDKIPLPTGYDLCKMHTSEVKSKNEWYYDCSKFSPQKSIMDLDRALREFFIKRKQKQKLPMTDRFHKKYLKKYYNGEIKKLTFKHEKDFPQFKKKGHSDRFYLEGSHSQLIYSEWNMMRIPIIGNIKLYEKLPYTECKNCTITRRSNKWFISFKQYYSKKIDTSKRTGKTGVDLGIKTLATLSDGTTFESPNAYKTNKKKLARLTRKLSRQYESCKTNKDKDGNIIYSKNFQKTKIKIGQLHLRISNIRKDATHKLTTYLVKNHDEINIEDLNVSGMIKNRHLSSAIADAGFYEFKRQLQYKCEWYGNKLTIVDRWFPSSQICSCCGHRQKMPLKKRVFDCEKCKNKIDRDLNAAINIKNYPELTWVKDCGDSKFHANKQVGISEAVTRQQA